jgi:hypothetical protein
MSDIAGSALPLWLFGEGQLRPGGHGTHQSETKRQRPAWPCQLRVRVFRKYYGKRDHDCAGCVKGAQERLALPLQSRKKIVRWRRIGGIRFSHRRGTVALYRLAKVDR